MNIKEATEKALKERGLIRRKSVHKEYDDRFAAVMPTNSYEACKPIIFRDGKPNASSRCWNPTAEDLMADDWEVCLQGYELMRLLS